MVMAFLATVPVLLLAPAPQVAKIRAVLLADEFAAIFLEEPVDQHGLLVALGAVFEPPDLSITFSEQGWNAMATHEMITPHDMYDGVHM